jgi:Flp pilus assembly protein TadD
MFHKRLMLFAAAAVFLATSSGFAGAANLDFKIKLPKRSELTPVQRLNREGVEAIRKHNYDKAEALFYKAYLYDAADPFTLNNLGYVSELRGNLKRAQRFYALAAEQNCTASIDLSNAKQLEGKPMKYAFSDLKNVPMQVNQLNVEAIHLLSQGRNFEADQVLRKALKLNPKNAFTLNNLGVAEEATGDFQGALKNYDLAASAHSTEPVVVTLDRSWRGKPVSEMAAASAQNLRTRIQAENRGQQMAAMLAIRGVHSLNSNDWTAAKKDFLNAYSADPTSAFSLNNLGYIAEKSGDIETAKFYYSKAQRAGGSNLRVGWATEQSAVGKPLDAVAGQSGNSVGREIEVFSQAAHKRTGPVQLIPRGGAQLNPNPPAKTSPAPPEQGKPQPQ